MNSRRTAGWNRFRLTGQATGLDPAGQALLSAAMTAVFDGGPPRPGGVIDQFTNRVIEMAGCTSTQACNCPLCEPAGNTLEEKGSAS